MSSNKTNSLKSQSSRSSATTWNNLNHDAFSHISHYLKPKEQGRLRTVSKATKGIGYNAKTGVNVAKQKKENEYDKSADKITSNIVMIIGSVKNNANRRSNMLGNEIEALQNVIDLVEKTKVHTSSKDTKQLMLVSALTIMKLATGIYRILNEDDKNLFGNTQFKLSMLINNV